MTVRTASKATARFVAVVERIVAAHRQPTPWEAGCLYAALCALSLGDDAEAERKILLASLTDIKGDPPVTVVPTPTADELLHALQVVMAKVEAPHDALSDPPATISRASPFD